MASVTRARWESDYAKLERSLASADPAAAKSLEALEALRVRLLGRKGGLTELLKALKGLPLEARRELGPRAQALKSKLEFAIEARQHALERAADEAAASASAVDPTRPALTPSRGRLHPLTRVLREMKQALALLGFSEAEGPLVEDDKHNFTALNIPEHHPARDLHDTFYLPDTPLLLRTHTSPVQIRVLEAQKPPIRIMAPGRVFRHEQADATHSCVFHQVEGLAVAEGLTVADLKGTLEVFMRRLFGPETKLRFRPSYFPFTEPSAEVDCSCFFCRGAGCAVCKRGGWIELLGAGLVHPNVLRGCGVDPERFSGFAFGIGVERVAMLRLGVPDIRMFYENDLRFLRQFDESIV